MSYKLIEQISENKNIMIVPHINPDVDAIISAILLKKVLHMNGIKSKICLLSEPDMITKNILEKNHLYFPNKYEKAVGINNKLILVDWFSLGSVRKAIPNEIIACFDHHPTNQNINYPIYINGQYSSTSKLIYDLFIANSTLYKGNTLKEIVKNVLFSIYVDTNSLKSSKFNKKDLEWIQEMIHKYEFSEEELIKVGYCLNDLTLPIHDLIFNGVKKYILPNHKQAYISYLATEDYKGQLDNEIKNATSEILVKENMDYFWLMISDMKNDKTTLLKNHKIKNSMEFSIDYISYLASRSLDIYPQLEKLNS